MTVTVTPEKFTMVNFDADAIARITQKLLDQIGLPDLEVQINIDETSPLGRTHVTSLDPVVIDAESGALEDPKRPRGLSEPGTADVLGRALLRVADRREPGFADAPADADLTLPQSVSWAVYANGRLERFGYPPQRQRWLYHFRNRHGFTDAADAAFDRLWAGPSFTWAEIVALSDDALARQPAA
jgi:hypothetical protein